METKVIAIDGPAGAGKSTVAKRLARALNFSYLDTGAMYRALTLKAIKNKVNLENEDELVDLASRTKLDLELLEDGVKVLLDGQDVSQDIRTVEVTNKTFYVAQKSRIREIMVNWQRDIAGRRNVVVEGRDVGTVVFPQACNKFYLDADLNERSKRRHLELKEKGNDVDLKKLTNDLEDRDHKDKSRDVGPLKKADDAVFINTTDLSIDQVVDQLLKIIKNG